MVRSLGLRTGTDFKWKGMCGRDMIGDPAPAVIRYAATGCRSAIGQGDRLRALGLPPTPNARETGRSACAGRRATVKDDW